MGDVNSLNELSTPADYTYNPTTGVLSAPKVTATDDIYTVPWTNYAGTSTIEGFASFENKIIRYKKVGKLVFCQYYLRGAGQCGATNFKFTLPYTIASDSAVILGVSMNMDNATQYRGFIWPNVVDDVAIGVYISREFNAGEFSGGTGTVDLRGSFFYETAE